MLSPDFFYILFFILGAAFGSFLNVLDLRYSPEKNIFDFKIIGGRSHCLYCGRNLSALELVPLFSFFIQRGRCRSCGKKISWQYPLVEAISGMIFVTIPLFLNNFFGINALSFFRFDAPLIHYFVVALWLLVFLVWLLVVLIDLKHYLIPDELNIALVILGIIYLCFIAFNPNHFSIFRDSFIGHYNILFSLSPNPLVNHLIGGLVGFVFFAAICILTRGRTMEMRDAKLALPSGILLGFADIGLAIALAFLIGGAAGVALIGKKRKTLHDKIPFAPFLVLGFVLTFFFGADIIAGYFALFPLP